MEIRKTMSQRIYAFANQKGGVGKTTSCVNMASSLVVLNQRVLLIDLDPQGNATMGSGVDKSAVVYSMNDLLQQSQPIDDVIIHCTTTPTPALLAKCRANIQAGKRPMKGPSIRSG